MNRDRWTLQDYVVYLVASQKTKTPEFEALINIYGREKLLALWAEYRHKIKPDHNKVDDKNSAE